MAETLEERRAEALVELEEALEEIEGGEGLSTFVEGHGIQSRAFRFEWSEPKLQISYELPTGRVLSGEEAEKRDEAEIAAAVRMALVLLRSARDGKIEGAGYGSISVSCDDDGARYAIRAEDGSTIAESEGWSSLVKCLEDVLGDASEDLVVIWP